MKNFGTKENVLAAAVLGTVTFYMCAFQITTLCGNTYRDCWDILDLIWPPFSFAPPLLILSLVTYKMSDKIFHAWVSFAKWWVPLSIVAILVTPVESGGWISLPFQAMMAAFCAATLLFVSLGIICWKHFSLKKKA